MAAGIERGVLPSETLAASVAGHSKDLSTPVLSPSCGVKWVEPEHSHWERTTVCSSPQAVHEGCVIL